jgi:hypothetical protein
MLIDEAHKAGDQETKESKRERRARARARESRERESRATPVTIRHTSAYVSILQHTSAHRIRQDTSGYVRIR